MFWTMYSAKPLFPKSLFALPTVHLVESDKFLLWGAIIHLDEPGYRSWSHSDVICLLKLRGLHVLNRVYYKTPLSQVTVCIAHSPFGGIWKFPLVGSCNTPSWARIQELVTFWCHLLAKVERPACFEPWIVQNPSFPSHGLHCPQSISWNLINSFYGKL